MNIPEKEKKTKEDIVQYMKKCAKQYVPEWRYDQEHPDAGTAMVSLFSDMMYDNIKRFNRSAMGDVLSFFDEVSAKLLPATPAEGFITFEQPEGIDSEVEVPKGTQILSEAVEQQLVFETQEDVLVRQMNVDKIYLSNPKEDGIYQIYDRQKDEKASFFLFQNGRENLQKHNLFFCFGRGLEIYTSANIELSLQVVSQTVGEKELKEAFVDPTKIRFYYGTEEGYEPIVDYEYEEGRFRFEIEGQKKIAVKEEFDSMYTIRAEILDVRFFSQVFISNVVLSSKRESLKPDSINVNGTDQDREEFAAFGETLAMYNEFYIASEEVFGKAGSNIKVEFDLDFVKVPLEALMGDTITWKNVMKKGDFVPDQEYDITIQEVIWEYYNGYGWKRIESAAKYKDVFNVGKDLYGQRKKMEFTCPEDIQPILVNSAETYHIRARVLKINNEYKTNGAYIIPIAGNFALGYDFAPNPLISNSIVKQNNMEISKYQQEEMQQEGFAVAISDLSPDKKTSCYIGFADPPVGGPLKLLFVMHDTMHRNMPGVEWEYLGDKGWKKMNLVDGTKAFHHTGLVSWFGSQDIQKYTLFEQNLFWIRMIDSEEAYRGKNWKEGYPKVEGIYPNSTSILGVETIEETYTLDPYLEEKRITLSYPNIAEIQVHVLERTEQLQEVHQRIWKIWTEVDELQEDSGNNREFVVDRQSGVVQLPKYMDDAYIDDQGEIEIRINYQYCKGAVGNLKAGEVNRLAQTVGFINNSYNPVATVCGTSGEDVMEAVKRNAKALRHGYRCVSVKDYEDMAWEVMRDISKVKCFSGYDQNRKKEAGAVTLVVLPKNIQESSYSFEKMRAHIYEYLASHMDENIVNLGKFHVVRPELIRIDVKASIELTQEKEVFTTRKRVLEALERFLDPVRGNFHGEGWEIGTLPNKNQIINVLKRVEGVKHIGQLTLRKYRRDRFEEVEVDTEELLPVYLLPKSGIHEILVDM